MSKAKTDQGSAVQGDKRDMPRRPQGKQQGRQQRGGFVLGLIVGLLLGLAIALGVALYITKVPVPFVNKVQQRSPEQDAEESARNRNWDPNAPLAGKSGAKVSSGVVSQTPDANGASPQGAAPAAPAQGPAAVPAPVAVNPVPTATTQIPAPAPAPVTAKAKPERSPEKSADKAEDKSAAVDPNVYFVQVGAFVRADDAEQQRAKAAMLGFSAKVFEKEQSGRSVFRVRLGPLDSRDEAEAMQRKLEAAGMEANLVRVQR